MSSLADLNWEKIAASLGKNGIEVIIVGGQAVNFWGEFFSIQEERPHTSIDVDVILKGELNELEAILDGELIKANNPLDALLATFEFEEEFKMDILIPDKIMGLSNVETNFLKDNAKNFGTFKVADPISMLKAKLGNLFNLDQNDRQDAKHARILLLAIRKMFERMIDETKSEKDSRVIIKEMKRFLKIAGKAERRNALKKIDRNLADAIPFSRFEEANCEKLQRFYESNLSPLLKAEDS